jgi:hypothetical protein
MRRRPPFGEEIEEGVRAGDARRAQDTPFGPALSLTPVKKRRITARSTRMPSSSRPRMSVTQAIVSFRIALCTGVFRLVFRN